MSDWRVRLILGVVAAVLAGSFVWGLVKGEDPPDAAELRQSAETTCRMFVERRVDPLDVEHRALGSSTVAQDGDRFKVTDRAAIEDELVNYECEVTRLENGDWRLDELNVR